MKKREPKFLSAREQEDTEPFATSEGNNVARHSFTGLGKKRGNLGGKVDGSGSPDTDSVFSQKCSAAWQGAPGQRLTVAIMLLAVRWQMTGLTSCCRKRTNGLLPRGLSQR